MSKTVLILSTILGAFIGAIIPAEIWLQIWQVDPAPLANAPVSAFIKLHVISGIFGGLVGLFVSMIVCAIKK